MSSGIKKCTALTEAHFCMQRHYKHVDTLVDENVVSKAVITGALKWAFIRYAQLSLT